MDLLQACRAFVAVSDRGSFTAGARSAGVSQPVASRRIAALERQVGGAVLDRSGRRPGPTPLGLRLLPAARRLVEAADHLLTTAEDAVGDGLDLAVPAGWDLRDLVAVELAARDHDLTVAVVESGPGDRSLLLRQRHVHAALVPRPPDTARWTVGLGVGSALDDSPVVHLAALRPARGGRRGPTVWVLPEDDVPHVRDRLGSAAEAAGLAPTQVVTGSPAAAVTAALTSHDLVVCSPAEAERWDLVWRPLADPALVRGYDLAADGDVRARLVEALDDTLRSRIGRRHE